MPNGNNHRQEACKTYIEQTKLLVTLSSAFILAPAAIFTLLPNSSIGLLISSEVFFISSVISGYVVLGTITGSQMLNTFNVYRPATRISSLLQLVLYVIGLILFIFLITSNNSEENKKEQNENDYTVIIKSLNNGYEINTNKSMIIMDGDTLYNSEKDSISNPIIILKK